MPKNLPCCVQAEKTRRTRNNAFQSILTHSFLAATTCLVSQLPAMAGEGLFPSPPPAGSRSHFFASPQACASAGEFSRVDCTAAFGHVADLIRERAPKFTDKYECIMQFRLCEKDAASFLPAALGVEVRQSPKGLIALPVLAVETPRDMLRDPVALAPDHGGRADVTRQLGRLDRAATSPYGALEVDAAKLASVAPPSLTSYRRFVEDVQRGQPVIQPGIKVDSIGRAEQ
jgi:Protein of unknown function (DUF1190)